MASIKQVGNLGGLNQYDVFQGSDYIGLADQQPNKTWQLNYDGNSMMFKTMKALKGWIDENFIPAPKPDLSWRISVKEACAKSGRSHNGQAQSVKDVRKFHPYLKAEQYGFFILRSYHEEIVRAWSDSKEPGWVTAVARSNAWLEANPWPFNVKKVDWKYHEQTGRVAYL